jgi:2-polyprenyl-6-methoxyphenol hydroxylase-like FAD-dependent oxidoreductase
LQVCSLLFEHIKRNTWSEGFGMRGSYQHDVLIVGAGIGGLTAALALHRQGLSPQIYEAAPALRPLGVGLNLLPHAVRELSDLGLEAKLTAAGIVTRQYLFYTRAGQLVYSEPRGTDAGYGWPQISIHRGDLHAILLEAVLARLGPKAIFLDHKCIGVDQDESRAIARFETKPDAHGTVLVACDGIHSAARSQMHPRGTALRYEGTTQYRGVTKWAPFQGGASMVYLGTNTHGKLVLYPIRNNIDGEGNQLLNWVIEVQRPADGLIRDWTRRAHVDDFIAGFEYCRFDWLDLPELLCGAEEIYEYPMVDQDPLPFWTQGRITLLGDAAHPMMPRGSNGAAQAIIDATTLANALATSADARPALKHYEDQRRPATSGVVMANRSISPDAILNVIEERTGGKPFERIEDVISTEELVEWQERYKAVAGFAARDLQRSGQDGSVREGGAT